MSEIRFGVLSAGRALEQFTDIRTRVDTEVVTGYEECRSRLTGSWKGNAADRFHTAAGRELEKLQRTAKLLEMTERCLGEAIRTAQRREEKAKEIAGTRI